MHSENKCEHLFDQDLDKQVSIGEMFEMQKSLQLHLAEKGRALNYDTASFKDKVDDITKQWRNINTEMVELLDRLPWKEWKTYSEEQLAGFQSDEEKIETYYEYIDVFHFFMNVGLALGIDGDTFEKLYVTKNQENFDRQARGY